MHGEIELQWGHRLSAVETANPQEIADWETRHASMGPPPFGSGNLAYDSNVGFMAARLQWGHRLSAVETT